MSSSIEGWKHCRPQVVVDGAFLSSAYGGTLLAACTYNANDGVLPLAFAIVDSKNNESYNWFFELFREAYGYRDDMCFISDRHDNIAKSIKEVYPEAGHYFCIYHLETNLKKYVYKNHDKLYQLLFKTAKAYTNEAFEIYFLKLKKMGPSVGKYMTKDVPMEKWAAVHSKQNRRQALTSNIAECLNAVNKMGRKMSMTALMEQLRSLCQRWSFKFRTEANNTVTTFSSKYHNILLKRKIKSSAFKIIPSSEYIFNISSLVDGKNYTVDLQSKSVLATSSK